MQGHVRSPGDEARIEGLDGVGVDEIMLRRAGEQGRRVAGELGVRPFRGDADAQAFSDAPPHLRTVTVTIPPRGESYTFNKISCWYYTSIFGIIILYKYFWNYQVGIISILGCIKLELYN